MESNLPLFFDIMAVFLAIAANFTRFALLSPEKSQHNEVDFPADGGVLTFFAVMLGAAWVGSIPGVSNVMVFSLACILWSLGWVPFWRKTPLWHFWRSDQMFEEAALRIGWRYEDAPLMRLASGRMLGAYKDLQVEISRGGHEPPYEVEMRIVMPHNPRFLDMLREGLPLLLQDPSIFPTLSKKAAELEGLLQEWKQEFRDNVLIFSASKVPQDVEAFEEAIIGLLSLVELFSRYESVEAIQEELRSQSRQARELKEQALGSFFLDSSKKGEPRPYQGELSQLDEKKFLTIGGLSVADSGEGRLSVSDDRQGELSLPRD